LQRKHASVVGFVAGLPDFSWSKHTKTGTIYQRTTNYTKRPYVVPNGHKLYQKALKYFPFYGPSKYTQIGTFGLKINHLAILLLGALQRHESLPAKF
jgi:hypothetical protein